MKSLNSIVYAFVCSIFFYSCSSSTTTSDETSVSEEKCTYTYLADSTSLKWTAYKFSNKTGVAGTFENIEVTKTQVADTRLGVFVGAEFAIETGSVNSGNVERDPKLIEFSLINS